MQETGVEINPIDLPGREIYKILTGSILPRPIAWVSTLDHLGNQNLAPFSFFTVASVNPPVLCFSPLLNDDKLEKDTLTNIRQTGDFVVNLVSYDLVEPMNQSSAPYRSDVSEFDRVGVTAHPSTVVKAPGVKESLVRFECTLRQIISFGSETLAGNLILGDICKIHLHQDVYLDGKMNGEILDAVGRLMGNLYATTRDNFVMARPNLPPDEQAGD